MCHSFIIGLVVIFASFVLTESARAEKRVALVIGNEAYEHAPKLATPTRDAAAIAGMFRKAGFEEVITHNNVGNLEFKRALRNFLLAAQDSDIAVVYYSGHGIQIDDQNYMVPVDAKLAQEYDGKDEAISLERIVDSLAPAKRMRLVILDACRDNPFVTKRVATSGATRGLAPVGPTMADTLIAYAAKAGSTASDGRDDHSPFTKALLKHIAEPGLDIRLAFGRVRDDVLKQTGNEQEPFVFGSLGGSVISLVPAPAVGSAERSPMTAAAPSTVTAAERSPMTAGAPSQVTAAAPATDSAAEAWQRVKVAPPRVASAKKPAEFEAHRARLEAEKKAAARREAEGTRRDAELKAAEAARVQAEAAKKAAEVGRERIAAARPPEAASGEGEAAEKRRAEQAVRREAESRAAEAAKRAELAAKKLAEVEAKKRGAKKVADARKESPRRQAEEIENVKAKKVGTESESAHLAKFADFDAPDIVLVGQSFPVSVSLREERNAEEHSAQATVRVRPAPDGKVTPEGKLNLPLPQDREVWEIDVDLSAPGFAAEQGQWSRRIKVPRHGESDVARFVLTAERLDPSAGSSRWLNARLYHQGRFLGSLSRPLDVRERSTDALPANPSLPTGSVDPRRSLRSPASEPEASAFNISLTSEVPDLDVFLEYEHPERLGAGRLTIRSPHFREFVSAQFTTSVELRALLEHEYVRLVQLGKSTRAGENNNSAKQRAIEAVRGIGRTLWREYLPDQLKIAILKLEESGKLASLQITSNSPIIPWELVLPERNGAGREPEFLGIAYRLGRWAPRRSVEQLNDPVKSFELRELHTIATKYEGKAYLPFQKAVIDYLRTTKGFQEHPGDFASVKRLVGNRIVGVVHFSGHGDNSIAAQGDALYNIRLSDGAVDPQSWSEFTRSRAMRHPFFFFNACETGQSQSFGGFVQGWGPTILATGAGGVHWWSMAAS